MKEERARGKRGRGFKGVKKRWRDGGEEEEKREDKKEQRRKGRQSKKEGRAET